VSDCEHGIGRRETVGHRNLIRDFYPSRPIEEAAHVFEEILNIPAHPLIVHAAVVLVPMQIAVAFAYALVPFVRRYTAWLVIGLAVAAPLAAWAAKKSGEALRNRLIRRGATSEQVLAGIDQHMDYADIAAWSSVALGLLMLVLVALLMRRGRSTSTAGDAGMGGGLAGTGRSFGAVGTGATVIGLVLTVLILGVGGVTGYYIFRAGDSGAHLVWEGI
jgi:hypothetical protein